MSACQPPERKWAPSRYQAAIFEDAARGTGHTVVVARAGSGKTSTIVEALTHVPTGTSTLLVAFNKDNAADLARKAPRSAEVATLHSFGFGAVRRAFGNVRLDKRKTYEIVKKMFPQLAPAEGEDPTAAPKDGSADIARQQAAAVRQAVTMAKATLAKTPAQIERLVGRQAITAPDMPMLISQSIEALAECRAHPEVVDFDDMIWLPADLGLRVRQSDRVYVDETQDLNAAQIALTLAACATGGRVCAVGDDRQAIYGFRGADENAVGNVIHALAAKKLPLSVCYRCDRAIVEEAQEVVPDIEAKPGAARGLVRCVDMRSLVDGVGPGDMVLSRSNAPLVALFFKLIAAGRRAKMTGRDIGQRIYDLVRSMRAKSVTELLGKVREWEAREVEELVSLDPPGDTSIPHDTATCVYVFARGARTVQDVKDRIDDAFDDEAPENCITLSSTHRAKGKERPRVWVLKDTYRKRPTVEEENLWYVAVTRAQHELYLVEGGVN